MSEKSKSLPFGHLSSTKESGLQSLHQGSIDHPDASKDTSQTSSQQINNIESILQSLRKTTFDYNDYLYSLIFQEKTIDVNLENYSKQLEAIVKKATKHMDTAELSLLKEFIDYTEQKYKLQIQKDIEFFEQGLKLIKNKTNAFNSQIEFNKNERNRKFQTLVSVGGSGLAAATIAANTGNYQMNCESIISPAFHRLGHTLNCHHPDVWASPLLFNIFAGVIFGSLIGFITWAVRCRYQ